MLRRHAEWFRASGRAEGPRAGILLLVVGLALLVGVVGTGCATAPGGPLAGEVVALTPQGPGHVFRSAEAAAVDALAYSHLAARRETASRRSARAGTIFAVAGGYSYAEPARAAETSSRLLYRLRPSDVLHFRHYPAQAWLANGAGPTALHERDRRLVDARDPLHRPIFFMSPDRRIRVYAGSAAGDRDVARLAAQSGPHDVVVALAPNGPAIGQEPLALQPRPESMPARGVR